MSETGSVLWSSQPSTHFCGIFRKIGQKRLLKIICLIPPEPKPVAERVGFEPTVRVDRTPDFESGAFDHSATFLLLDLYCQMPARADFKVLGTNLQLAVTMQAG